MRAQYAAGSIGGQAVRGYREEPNVSPTSTTETFVALKLFIDSWRWAGVPFYLRSGKRLPKRVTEIAVHFKEAPHLLFGRRGESIRPNVLAIRIQPDEGIALNFGSKLPGPAMEIAPVSMEFRYGSSFGVEPPEAYERLLLDCLLGDSTLFTRADEVEASWTWVSRIHRRWAEEAGGRTEAARSPTYPAGIVGPPAAERLLTADGRAWRLPRPHAQRGASKIERFVARRADRGRGRRDRARAGRAVAGQRAAPARRRSRPCRGRRCGT